MGYCLPCRWLLWKRPHSADPAWCWSGVPAASTTHLYRRPQPGQGSPSPSRHASSSSSSSYSSWRSCRDSSDRRPSRGGSTQVQGAGVSVQAECRHAAFLRRSLGRHLLHQADNPPAVHACTTTAKQLLLTVARPCCRLAAPPLRGGPPAPTSLTLPDTTS